MSLFKIYLSIIIILMVILVKVPSSYSDEVSTDAVRKMPLTGNLVKEKDNNLGEELNDDGIKKVDINNADIEELKTLYGIGPVIAKRIIQYRKAHGRFNTIEDIIKVNGISDKKFKKLKDMITVKEPISKKDDKIENDERSEVK